MSWQKTDEWPDGRADGGAFRSAAEVIVARREAPTFVDRFRTWWHSTPDHPFGAMALRVVLTPNWIYVETRRGDRQRAPVDRILGSKREGGRVIYAVADGDDLVIADRKGDALERALDEKIGAVGEWRSSGAFATVFIAAAIGLAIALATTLDYREEALQRIDSGMTTSEAALGLYAGLGGVLLVFLFITFFPQRYVADSLGLVSVRGLFGWVRTMTPVERIAGVRAGRAVSRGKNGNTYTRYFVDVIVSDPAGATRVHVAGTVSGGDHPDKREEARQIGRRIAWLYDVELSERVD